MVTWLYCHDNTSLGLESGGLLNVKRLVWIQGEVKPLQELAQQDFGFNLQKKKPQTN